MDIEPEEYRLARRARDGNTEALADLIEQTRMSLFAQAYAALRHYEDAQDAVAGALVLICRHVGQLRDPERVRAWMGRIVQNEVRRIIRERAPETTGAAVDEARASAAEASPSLLRLDIEQALRSLPRDQARALTLFYLSGLSIRDIARQTGRPEGTITRWLHLGRRRLAVELEGYAPMPPDLAAAIIGTDLDSAVIQRLADALRGAGFRKVTAPTVIRTLADLYRVSKADWPFSQDLHLAEPLVGSHLILLDEWIAGRSAFELFNILKATPEGQNTAFCLLIQSPSREDSTLFSAWASGFDLCFARDTEAAVLRRWFGQVREALQKGWGQKRRRGEMALAMRESFEELRDLVRQIPPAAPPKAVLVVDDEPDVIHLLRTNLESAGYHVNTAESGRQLLEEVQTLRPDLIVLDDLVPPLDGPELFRRLRADLATAAIPVIMLSTRTRDADVFQGWQSGVDAYMTKAVNPAEFLRCVRQALGEPGADEETKPAYMQDGPDASPLVRIAHTIIQQAILDGATEVRIEPGADSLAVSFRIDGELHEVMRLPRHLQENLVARYKYMADLIVEQHDARQDGHIAISHDGRDYDLHVTADPGPQGEQITMSLVGRE
jgi:RNA polymerase sigma-70 factor (ECF subfamily)